MNIEVNYIAVFAAAIASMIVGFIYYHPAVLGKPWMKAMGYSPEKLKKEQKQMGKLYGVSFVLALITAYVLSHVMALSMAYFKYDDVTAGVSSAFWMWLGFVMPVQATGEIFGAKRWKAVVINTGYQLVAMLAMGLVLGMM